MQAIRNSQLVWVTLVSAAQGSRWQFPDVPELRNRAIYGLEVFNVAMLTNTPDLVACISAADLIKCTVTIKDFSRERLRDVPLSDLLPTNVQGIWKQTTPFVANWQSSFVLNNGAAISGTVTVPFQFFYDEPTQGG